MHKLHAVLSSFVFTLDSCAGVCRSQALHWVLAQQVSSMLLGLFQEVLNCSSRICIPCMMHCLLDCEKPLLLLEFHKTGLVSINRLVVCAWSSGNTQTGLWFTLGQAETHMRKFLYINILCLNCTVLPSHLGEVKCTLYILALKNEEAVLPHVHDITTMYLL